MLKFSITYQQIESFSLVIEKPKAWSKHKQEIKRCLDFTVTVAEISL